jgi:hypothetical protein
MSWLCPAGLPVLDEHAQHAFVCLAAARTGGLLGGSSCSFHRAPPSTLFGSSCLSALSASIQLATLRHLGVLARCDTPCLPSCMQYADVPLFASWDIISRPVAWNRIWRKRTPPHPPLLAILIFPVRPKSHGNQAGLIPGRQRPAGSCRAAAGHQNRTTARRRPPSRHRKLAAVQPESWDTRTALAPTA